MRPLLLAVFLVGCASARTFPSLPAESSSSSSSASPAASSPRAPSSGLPAWETPRPGIESMQVDRSFTVVRADLSQVDLLLLNRPATENSVRRLGTSLGSLLAINAGMFEMDYRTSVGYMRNFRDVNNPRFKRSMQGFLMFHPKFPGLPPVHIGGKAKIVDYDTVFQTFRMWDPDEGILWKPGKAYYYQAGLVGVDKQNRVLFFMHPGAIDMHQFVTMILALDLGLTGLLYLDGGSHGAMYLDPSIGDEVNTGQELPNLLVLQAKM